MLSVRRWTGWIGLLALAAGVAAGPSKPIGADDPDVRLRALNERFLASLDSFGPERALQVAAIREAWRGVYQSANPADFVVDSLTQLDEDFAAALAAFDAGDDAAAGERFAALRGSANPYVAACAAYFHVRTLAARGMFEEASAALRDGPGQAGVASAYCPYWAQMELLRGVSAARTLQFEAALETLAPLEGPGPEAVRSVARQVRMEVERREQGTLGEVATVMDYVGDRLRVVDATQRVQDRQREIIDLLDKLIEEEQQQEQQGGGGGAAGGEGQQPQQRGNAPPSAPRDESSAPPSGAAPPGDQHAAPRINPGEMWGKLPPAERERILEAIRERYPSRYRQIVEQYYRSLAEER